MQWYYVEQEVRIGPVSSEEMQRLIAAGRIGPESHVWRSGLQGWELASQHFGFPQAGAGQPPPMPGSGAAGGRERRLDRYRPPEPAGVPGPAGGPAGAGQGMTGPDGLYIHAPSRGFGEAISICFQRYFGFSGRASRSEYWFFILFTVLLGIGTSFLDGIVFGLPVSDDVVGPINTLTTLAVFIPTLAVGWRRLHDIGRSGWWIGGFFLAVPGLAVMMFLVILSIGDAGFSPAALGYTMPLFVLMLLGFVVYFIVMLVFMCTRGHPGPNHYG